MEIHTQSLLRNSWIGSSVRRIASAIRNGSAGQRGLYAPGAKSKSSGEQSEACCSAAGVSTKPRSSGLTEGRIVNRVCGCVFIWRVNWAKAPCPPIQN